MIDTYVAIYSMHVLVNNEDRLHMYQCTMGSMLYAVVCIIIGTYTP